MIIKINTEEISLQRALDLVNATYVLGEKFDKGYCVEVHSQTNEESNEESNEKPESFDDIEANFTKEIKELEDSIKAAFEKEYAKTSMGKKEKATRKYLKELDDKEYEAIRKELNAKFAKFVSDAIKHF